MSQKRIPKKVMRTIQEYILVLQEDAVPVDRVLLFGSYAQGKQHRFSDIDLCVISSQFRNPWKATQYLWSKRLHDTGLTIEPVGFSKKDFQEASSLVAEIKRTGINIPIKRSM